MTDEMNEINRVLGRLEKGMEDLTKKVETHGKDLKTLNGKFDDLKDDLAKQKAKLTWLAGTVSVIVTGILFAGKKVVDYITLKSL